MEASLAGIGARERSTQLPSIEQRNRVKQAPVSAVSEVGAHGGGEGMRASRPSKYVPRVSLLSFAPVAAVATGAGLLIRDAVGSQAWINTLREGLVIAGGEIKTFFTQTVPAAGSATAVACALGVGAFLASLVNLTVFVRGVTTPSATFSEQAFRGLKTVVSGAAAGAGWGAMAGVLGAGAGIGPGAAIGAVIGAGVGLLQAVIMLMNANPPKTLGQ